MANQVNKDAIVRFLAGYESDLAAVKVENGTVYFALKPDPLNTSNTIGSIYLDADGKRIMMSGESLAVRDELGDRILTKYIKGIDFDANSNAKATNNGAKGILTYVKGNGEDVNVDVPSASASAAGFVTTGAQTFAGTKTFNSPLIPLGGSYVHSATGTSGTSGYVKIATFKINGTYQNTPIVIELVDRVRKGSCVLNIQFQNANSNDPTLATFTFEGVDYNCYLYKSATSTWDLYVEKGEDYGQPTVVRFHKSPHMSKVAVTWTNAHADTIPSEAQPAVLGGNVANASNADSATKSTGDGQGNNIYTTYLSDLTSTNNASIFTIQGIKKNGGNSPTTITINGATTEKAGLMTAEEQSFAGEKEFTDTTTFRGTSGFEYSGIESATSNSARVVWFAHANKKGTPVYHNDFTYNPGTKTLTVGKITGTITKATGDGQGNEIYSTYLANVASSNDGTTFNIWGLTKKGGDSPTIVTIGGATTKKAGLVTTGAQTWAGAKTFNDDITIFGAKTNIQKEGSSTSWIYGRDTALIKLTSYKGYNAITSMKTTNGDWSYGVCSNDISYWTYTPDTQYGAQDNKGYVQMKLTPAGKLITVNSETGHLFAKSVAIGSDNTNYKLYNIGTTYLADVLTVAARATVDTLKISKTEMVKHIEFAREGFNYIATAANGCIAFLPNGASPEKDTSRLIVEDGGARPGATNTYNLGTSDNRWKNIYGNALNISGTSTLTGAVTLGGNLSVGGTLGVTGATTLSSTLTVTGKTVLSSVVEIGNNLTVTGAIFGKDKLTIGQADLNTNYTVYVNGSSYFKGNVTSNGTLHLTKTTDGAATADNNVALIIGPRDSTHLIADNNEIMAKSNGTAAGPLYLNNDGGQVVVGAGGFTTSGYVDATGDNGFRIRKSNVTYGRFCAITAGTTSAAGVGHLTLGNATSTGTANNAAGVLRLYGLGDKYTDIRTVQGSGNYAYYFSNHGATAYSLGRDSSSKAYGSTVKPVWFNSSGMVTAFVHTVGSTAIPVYMNEGAITQVKPADMFSELKWVAGSSSGPVINMTIGTQNRTAKIPIATQTNSGVVIAGAQTFGGAKTFTGTVTVNDMMKVGRYIDFRCSTNTTTNDYYSVRFDAGTGDKGNVLYLPDITGQLVVHTNNIQIGSGTKPVYVAESGAVTASIATVGGTAKPIYMSDGSLTVCSANVGASDKPVYMSDGTITESDSNIGNGTQAVYMASGQIKASTSSVGGSTTPMYLFNGIMTSCDYGVGALHATEISATDERVYLLGTSSSSTGYRTTTYFDPEIYITTIPGELSCTRVESRGNLYGGNNIYLRHGTDGVYARLFVDTVGTSSTTDGIAGATGVTYMYLGNSKAVSTAAGYGFDNSCGVLRIYGSSTGYTDIRCGMIHDPSGEYTLYLPRGTGQIVYHTNDTQIGGPDTPVFVTFAGKVMPCSTNLTDYVLKAGDTMTGNLAIEKASGSTKFTTERTDTGASVSFGVGFGGTERGVHDNNLGKWIIYSDGTDAKTELKLYGAVWNDYAEFRQTKDKVEPGRVVIETGRGDLKLSTERLQPGANVVSDTFGFAIGETKKAKTPLAVAGRVLVYTFEDKYSYKPGDAVCTGPNGTVSKMTREEIWKYPERIVGTVSEIPEYEIWESGDGPIQVNSRIWIKVK